MSWGTQVEPRHSPNAKSLTSPPCRDGVTPSIRFFGLDDPGWADLDGDVFSMWSMLDRPVFREGK